MRRISDTFIFSRLAASPHHFTPHSRHSGNCKRFPSVESAQVHLDREYPTSFSEASLLTVGTEAGDLDDQR